MRYDKSECITNTFYGLGRQAAREILPWHGSGDGRGTIGFAMWKKAHAQWKKDLNHNIHSMIDTPEEETTAKMAWIRGFKSNPTPERSH